MSSLGCLLGCCCVHVQGAALRALSNTSRTFASDSPNHMVSSSGPLIEMKLAEDSLAMALARRVFPERWATKEAKRNV